MHVLPPPSSSSSENHSAAKGWVWLLFAALLLAYVAPWLSSNSAALTFGGYDLGEWASLPPGVRSQTPPLVASFLLRLPLALVTLYLAFAAAYRRWTYGWLLTAGVCLLLVVAQVPPLEFFTTFRTDPNYGQQATLALISLIGVLVGLLMVRGRWRWLIAALVAALGAVCSIAGVLTARELMVAYRLTADIRTAVWLMALLFAAAALWAGYRFVRSFV